MVNENQNLQDDLVNDLIKRFNDGDENAWKFIMDSYWERMITVGIHTQLSLHMDIDVAQAEDITQDAWTILFTRCLEKKNHFENIGQIIKWIRETQAYLLKNLRRKASTRNEKPMQEDDNGEAVLPQPVNDEKSIRPVEERVIRREESGWIWSIVDQVLGEFDNVDQSIVIRRLIMDEKSNAIAQSEGKSVEHVYRVTERAWAKLKNYAHAESFFLRVAEMAKRRSTGE
jgi:RNA polymerase sigma factor (sigma-70 family)